MTTFGRLTTTARTFNLRGQSPFAQGVMILSGVLVAIVVLPLLLLLALVMAAVIGWHALRARVRRLRSPNGALDGRRNVRVRIPGTTAD